MLNLLPVGTVNRSFKKLIAVSSSLLSGDSKIMFCGSEKTPLVFSTETGSGIIARPVVTCDTAVEQIKTSQSNIEVVFMLENT
jgi:hypothetical protein